MSDTVLGLIRYISATAIERWDICMKFGKAISNLVLVLLINSGSQSEVAGI